MSGTETGYNAAPHPAVAGLSLPDRACIAELTGDVRYLQAYAQLHPQDFLAVIEAADRFSVDPARAAFPPPPTQLSSAAIGRRMRDEPEPSLAFMLLAAHRLGPAERDRERTPAEGRRRTATRAGSAVLGAVELTGALLEKVSPRVLDPIVLAPATAAAVARHGLETVGRRPAAKLHKAVSDFIFKGHHVRYNDIPGHSRDDDIMAAWLYAESMARLCHDGRVRPGCGPLAEHLADRLLRLYARGILVDVQALETRPNGIELIDFGEALRQGKPIGEAVQVFARSTKAMQGQRAKKAKSALDTRPKTTAPETKMMEGMLPGIMEYRATLLRHPARLAEEAQAAERLLDDPNKVIQALDDLTRIDQVVRERLDAAGQQLTPDMQEYRALSRLRDYLGAGFGARLRAHVLDKEQIQSISQGRAPLATMRYAADLLFARQPYTGPRSTELGDALAAAACRWYRQPLPEKTLKTTVLAGSELQVYEPPIKFSETRGVAREGYRLMIGAFLYDAARQVMLKPEVNQAARDLDLRLHQARLRQAAAGFTGPTMHRKRLLQFLPPAAERVFSVELKAMGRAA